MQKPHVRSAAAAGTLALGDLTVHRMGFGAMRLTGDGVWGPPADRAGALAVLRRAVELGVELIDTADSYGPEVDEELIAEALAPYPARVVVATKGGWRRPGPGKWEPQGEPSHLRAALEGSLRRLRLERIDLYQLHVPDPKVPYEAQIGTLAELQQEGKIRHIGLSNVSLAQLETARRTVAVVSVQNRFNLEDRDESREILAYCEREGIAFLPWAPIAAGSFARREVLERIARAHEATTHQIALSWLLRRSPAMLPIPGTASLAHLEENVAAASLALDDREFAQLGA